MGFGWSSEAPRLPAGNDLSEVTQKNVDLPRNLCDSCLRLQEQLKGQ